MKTEERLEWIKETLQKINKYHQTDEIVILYHRINRAFRVKDLKMTSMSLYIWSDGSLWADFNYNNRTIKLTKEDNYWYGNAEYGSGSESFSLCDPVDFRVAGLWLTGAMAKSNLHEWIPR